MPRQRSEAFKQGPDLLAILLESGFWSMMSFAEAIVRELYWPEVGRRRQWSLFQRLRLSSRWPFADGISKCQKSLVPLGHSRLNEDTPNANESKAPPQLVEKLVVHHDNTVEDLQIGCTGVGESLSGWRGHPANHIDRWRTSCELVRSLQERPRAEFELRPVHCSLCACLPGRIPTGFVTEPCLQPY